MRSILNRLYIQVQGIRKKSDVELNNFMCTLEVEVTG